MCPLLLLAVLAVLWLSTSRPPPDLHAIPRAPRVDDRSLTAVLPVAHGTLHTLDDLLAVPTTALHEVAILCPQALVADVHRRLGQNDKASVHPWSGPALEFVPRVKTRWVLLLDERGLQHVSECDRAYLLHPRAVQMPVGPHGYAGAAQLSPSDRAQPAMFLVPPFVAPSSLLAGAPLTSPVWPALGNHIAKSTLVSFGGIVIGSDARACNSTTTPASPLFVLIFPRKEDLERFLPATCKLFRQGYTLLAYLYDEIDISRTLNQGNCSIPYLYRSKTFPRLSDWLGSLGSVPDVVIGLDHQDSVSSTLSFMLEQPPFLNTTLIRLPRSELPYAEWIGTLTLHELRNWNVPEITLSVITNNRPYSLRRLLGSIQRTLFFGDKVDIRINMDQTSDPETMQLVHDFDWPHGDVSLHHRVIHGGLLPAVVESWYPDCDDSYGLLLEDDVELSPLSYAWTKMTLLRYKYGNSSPSSSRLFGISLYQQKMIELRPQGRQPFDARALFRSASLADPTTPYLSQIPCSWGALYFPSHWREFHDYLSLRLSQHAFSIGSTIVPGVRSNKWSKSWKKYFIELVYLRGYVMLYPNYDDFASLSTNHLEVGSHVRSEPGEVYEEKKRLFLLPLMSLAGASAGDAVHGPRLLDLPGGKLSDWDRLPVLDLLGEVSSMEAIQKRGVERRSELGACVTGVVDSLPSGMRDLLCP